MTLGLIIWLICLAAVAFYVCSCRIKAWNLEASFTEELLGCRYISGLIIGIVVVIGLVCLKEYGVQRLLDNSLVVLVAVSVLSAIWMLWYFDRTYGTRENKWGRHLSRKLPPPVGPPPPQGNPDFHDEELDRLIDAGNLIEARKRLLEIIKVAKEIQDIEVLENYRQYEIRLNEAALNGMHKYTK